MFMRPYTLNNFCNFRIPKIKTINHNNITLINNYKNFKISKNKFLYLISFICNFY